MPRLAAQAGAAAVRAGLGAEVLGQLLAHALGLGFPVAPLQVGHYALEGVFALDDIAPVVQVAEGHLLAAGTLQNQLAVLFADVVEGLIQIDAVVLGQRAEHLEVVDVAPIPAADGPFGQGQFTIDQAAGIEELLDAQTIAAAAGAGRVVEGEQPRLQLADRVAALGAGKAGAEGDFLQFLAVHGSDDGDAIGQVQGGLEGLGQTQLQVLADLEAVYHHLDGVLAVLFQRRRFVQLVDAAVDAGADKALGAQLVEQCQVLALALAHHRCQQHQLAALGQRQHLVDHLADGLCRQGQVMIRAARLPGAGKQQAQVIVDLGDGADGGAGVVRGGLLLDGDGR